MHHKNSSLRLWRGRCMNRLFFLGAMSNSGLAEKFMSILTRLRRMSFTKKMRRVLFHGAEGQSGNLISSSDTIIRHVMIQTTFAFLETARINGHIIRPFVKCWSLCDEMHGTGSYCWHWSPAARCYGGPWKLRQPCLPPHWARPITKNN